MHLIKKTRIYVGKTVFWGAKVRGIVTPLSVTSHGKN